jgi:hypothetical protein
MKKSLLVVLLVVAQVAWGTDREPSGHHSDHVTVNDGDVRVDASGGHAEGGAGGHATAAGGDGGSAKQTLESREDHDYLALGLPGQTAAPAVAGECLEHERGGSGLSIGVTGRTRLNKDCMAFKQCVALADRYQAWGQLQLAVEQLAKCGGIEAATLAHPPTEPATDAPECVPAESLDRAFVACQQEK